MDIVGLYIARIDFELQFHYENIAKHGVTVAEVEECFFDPKRIVRRIGAAKYWMVARTQAGRLLQIGFERKSKAALYVFHAMDAKRYERKQYKTRGK